MKHTDYQRNHVIPVALQDTLLQLLTPTCKFTTYFADDNNTRVYLAERAHFEKRYANKVK